MLRSLSEIQVEFAAALLDPAAVVPDVADPEGKPTPRRFAVYRNNVTVGLVNTVRGAFPAVRRIVGDDFFNATAIAFVRAEPPDSPVLLEYGKGFADFVARFEPARSLPYLADVARIERAWHEAYHAAEAASLGSDDLGGIGDADLPALTFSLHPSLRVVRSAYPALTIWRMNTHDESIVPVDLRAGGEDALVVRPQATVEVRHLPAGGATFIETLADGGPLSAAAELAGESDEGFDLSVNIAGLIESGAVVGYSTGD
jgi:hypothetical protein